MNVSTFANSFNAAAFVLALNSIEKNATTITRDVMAAHAAGKAALALIVSAVARIECNVTAVTINTQCDSSVGTAQTHDGSVTAWTNECACAHRRIVLAPHPRFTGNCGRRE